MSIAQHESVQMGSTYYESDPFLENNFYDLFCPEMSMSFNLSNYSNEFELNLRKHWPLPIESLQYISFPFHQCVDVSLDPHRQKWEKLRTKSHRPLQTHRILTANRHRNHIQTEDRTMALTQWFRIGHLRENKTNFIIHVDKFEKKNSNRNYIRNIPA